MKTRVFINGSEGTTGLRINERFEKRPDIEVIPISSELRKDPVEIGKKINESDITFFCLPDEAAKEALKLVTNPKVRIIDASTAHRTAEGWQYGFPELSKNHREGIISGNRITVPGCHATGFISLVYPLVSAGVIHKDALLSATSISGYSGAGKKAIAQYTEKEARQIPLDPLASPRQYALSQMHKHLKEMKKISGLTYEPVFLPLICDFYSGMVVSVPLHSGMLAKKVSPEELRQVYADAYKDSKLIRVLPLENEFTESGFLPANTISGQDTLDILVYGNEDRMVVSARFDNLGKGASGAAIQCMNIMLLLPEETGLVCH